MAENKESVIDNKEIAQIIKLAYIGEHFLQFINHCTKANIDPIKYVSFVKEQINNPETKLKIKEAPPILLFVEWLNDPSKENLSKLEKCFGITFNK